MKSFRDYLKKESENNLDNLFKEMEDYAKRLSLKKCLNSLYEEQKYNISMFYRSIYLLGLYFNEIRDDLVLSVNKYIEYRNLLYQKGIDFKVSSNQLKYEYRNYNLDKKIEVTVNYYKILNKLPEYFLRIQKIFDKKYGKNTTKVLTLFFYLQIYCRSNIENLTIIAPIIKMINKYINFTHNSVKTELCKITKKFYDYEIKKGFLRKFKNRGELVII